MTTLHDLEKENRHQEAELTRLRRRVEELLRPAQTIIPRPVAPLGGGLTTSAPTTTAARVGLVVFDQPIKAIRFTYTGTGGSNPSVMRFALYNESGAQKLFDKTDAINAASGLRTVSLGTPLYIPRGHYYLLMCLSSGATGPQVATWITASATLGFAPDANSPDLEGTLTISGGAAPATIDPPTITTPANSLTPAIRFDAR